MSGHHTTAELEPSIIVIFGITGDLAKRYLLPSLYHLFKDNLLHEQTKIIGLTRQPLSADELFGSVELCINEIDNVCDPVALKAMLAKTELHQFDPADATGYPKLYEYLNKVEESAGICMNRLYYLSIPPQLFTEVVRNIGAGGLNGSCQHDKAQTRLLVEKPFGHDLASAEALIAETSQVFREEQVFRIDHYLAKETVQNILSFRLHNPIFAGIWDDAHIDSIEVNAFEKIGIENRKNFYEGVGAVRDFVQSHLLQLVAVTTMELPAENDSEHIHEARLALLQSVAPADPAQALRGQYDTYTAEVGNANSTTETYASIKLLLGGKRWQGTPVTITTGKALAERRAEIIITFTNPHDSSDATNTLTFRLQPNEGIHLELRVKQPGFATELEDAAMDFSYQHTFGDQGTHPDAYERVLVDAVKGDRTLFATSEEVLASWRIIEPVIKAWEGSAEGLQKYASGSNGPKS